MKDILKRDIVIKLNGQILYENYIEHNLGAEPENYFEEWCSKITFKLLEVEKIGIWKIFINFLLTKKAK
jgi:hypothetical protein